MWARTVELMLGVWLAISPLVLRIDPLEFAALNAYVCAVLIVASSCVAYWPPARQARWLTAAVALWLMARSYLTAFGGPHPAPPELQNELTVGLLLAMFVIVPNDAGRPPEPWRPWTVSRG